MKLLNLTNLKLAALGLLLAVAGTACILAFLLAINHLLHTDEPKSLQSCLQQARYGQTVNCNAQYIQQQQLSK